MRTLWIAMTFFVSVSGANIDWKKLSVELYDGKDKISESRDYKITSKNYAVFRTVKTSDVEWPRQMTARYSMMENR